MTIDDNCQELQRNIMREFNESRKRTEENLKAGIGTEQPNDWFKTVEEKNNVNKG